MRKLLIAFALVAIIVSATMLPDVKVRVTKSLTKLAKSHMGKNIITAIQLQLSSGNKEGSVEKIVDLLQKLLEDTQGLQTTTQNDLESKEQYCDETGTSYASQIENKESTILSAQQSIPALETERQADSQASVDEQDKVDRLSQDLDDAENVNQIASEAFAKSQNNHNAMIAALEQAQELVGQLQSTSFLQSNTKVLAQISAHHKKSLNFLKNHRAKGLFSVLMQMAQDVGAQVDSSLVQSVLDIIAELLANEKQGVNDESLVEAQRTDEYNNKVAQVNADIQSATEEIARLAGEDVRLENEIQSANASIDEWSTQLASLQDALASLASQCQQEIVALTDLASDYNDEAEVIQDAIDIFQTQNVADVSPVVENLSSE